MSNAEKTLINWVRADNRVRELTEEISKARAQRTELTEELNTSLDDHYRNSAVEIDNSKLQFQVTRAAKPISLKFVERCLGECISDKTTVGKLMDYIKSKREFRETWGVKRTFFKQKTDGSDSGDDDSTGKA
jgi:hypothetical protein